MQFIVQPGDITLALNQMSNATFNCSCPGCDPEQPPYWTLEIDGDDFDITDPSDRPRLALRGISFNLSGLPVVISIPDRIENNNTMVMCAAFLGGIEFSDPVKVTIIGRSTTDCYKRYYIINIFVFQVPLYLRSQL